MAHRSPGDDIPEMTPTELNDRMRHDQPIVLLDVRELHERDIADLPEYGQLRIPVGELMDRLEEVDRDSPLVVYCRSGSRSAWAVRRMREEGYDSVWNLKGGLLGWKSEVDPSIQEY